MALVAAGTVALAGTETLVPDGSTWRYNDTGTDLGTAWRGFGYDDTSWPSGPAQLGYGDSDEQTLISNTQVRPCYYFRHTFSVADPGKYQSLNLEILRDDGAVVYLNGTEVARYNMPSGNISYGTWASSATEYSWDPPQPIANLLVQGDNIIAVEVHQGNSTSSDLSLDLILSGLSQIAIALDSPASGAIGVQLNAPLAATATDPEGQNLTVSFYGRPATAPQPNFTIVVLPDIQNYTAEINGGAVAILKRQTDWIRANRGSLNIVYVSQMGDVSQNGDIKEVEWSNASSALYTLETPLAPFTTGIPYGAAVGNHDQYVPSGDLSPTTFYNQYFGTAHFAGQPYYGDHYGDNNNNHYQLFSASGLDFLVVYLEHDTSPDQAVLDWADGILKMHPTRRAIVVTHYFLDLAGTFGPQGLAIYNALKDNPNLFLMLCGHNHGEAQRTDDYNGNKVYTLLADYQSYPNGGNGFLRTLEFSPIDNQIHVQTYSPWLNQYETDASSQFTLNYDMDTGPAYSLVQENPNVPSGIQTSATWPGLQPAKEYEWFVMATDGVDIQASDVRRFTTTTDAGPPPAAPTGMLASAQSDTQIRLSWTDNSSNESGFEVEQSLNGTTFTTLASVPANVTDVLVNELQPATQYTYRVRAVNAAGPSAYSDSASDITSSAPLPPEAPSNLAAAPISNSSIEISWTDNSSLETAYEVERSTDQIQWTALSMLSANTISFIDTGLNAGVIYYYRVRAWNRSSSSVTDGKLAAAPFIDAYASSETVVTGTVVGSRSNTLLNDSVYEQLTEKLLGGKSSRYSALEHRWTFAATPGKRVVFRVQAHRTTSTDGDDFIFAYSTDNVTYQNMVTITAVSDTDSDQYFTLPNTLQGTVYIRLKDKDQTIGKTVLDSLFIDHMLIRTEPNVVLPSAPTLASAVAANASVTLSWAASSEATSYKVLRSTTPGAGYELVASGVTSPTYVDSGLASGTHYYVIVAVNPLGESDYSNELSATTATPTVTAAPTNLAAVGARRKITLTWTQSTTPGVTANTIYRSTSSSGPFILPTTIPPSTTYSETLSTGTTYFYKVTAVANGSESGLSNTASATAK